MAVPKSYYFQHDYHASNDAKVLFLRQQLGMEGYGIYWFILEQLAQAGGRLPLKITPVLAMQSQTQETKIKAVIEGYDLFNISEDYFFSTRLNEHIEIRQYLSEMGKKGVELREAKRAASKGALWGASSNPLSKERKGKEIKEIKEGFFVFFEDGTSQPLGEIQSLEFKNGNILPKQILKGEIN
jgi:hypothetical protein